MLLPIICCALMWLSGQVYSHTQALLIFQDMSGQQLSDAAGMNIAHQALTALHQKAAPVLIAQDVWKHILQRKKRFDLAQKRSGTVEFEISNLVSSVSQKVRQKFSLDTLNIELNLDWYTKQYPALSVLGTDEYKTVMFDFLCAQLNQFIDTWDIYELPHGYMIAMLPSHRARFNMAFQKKIMMQDAVCKEYQSTPADLVTTLDTILHKKGVSWVFYVTGHGYHADETHSESMVLGMSIESFQAFLIFLQQKITTKLLIYSSCYSSGLHLIDPYVRHDQELLFDYPIITTCLMDAPVYVFGFPSGLKLPPYGGEHMLEAGDVGPQGLAWFFMQDFNKLVGATSKKINLKKAAQSVMVYQECTPQGCDLAKLENIPLVRKPKIMFFVPLETTYIDLIIHNSSCCRVVDGKDGLLWYIKRYDGTITLQNKLPQFVSMIPGDGVVWVQEINIGSYKLTEALGKCFFSIEDVAGVNIFTCTKLSYKDPKNKQECSLAKVMVIPHSAWVPAGIHTQNYNFCCYMKDNTWHAILINSLGSVMAEYQIPANYSNHLHGLWNLFEQESKQQGNATADALWSYALVKQRLHTYQEILGECIKQGICRTT